MVQGRPIVGARPAREEAGGSTWWWRVGGPEEGVGAGEAAVAARRQPTRASRGRLTGFTCSGGALCTKSGGDGEGEGRRHEEPNKVQWRWGVLGRGLGVLSCKRSNGVVAQSMVRLVKLPELHPRDA
ncbi:hypothetical protein ZWY2020_004284 [Hordeum vulgare]|nr:hypothetical protein ZWY2020_004284 [Hordeum vulgare]